MDGMVSCPDCGQYKYGANKIDKRLLLLHELASLFFVELPVVQALSTNETDRKPPLSYLASWAGSQLVDECPT